MAPFKIEIPFHFHHQRLFIFFANFLDRKIRICTPENQSTRQNQSLKRLVRRGRYCYRTR
jgi:hypothetical protein